VSRKPENVFINKVHKALLKRLKDVYPEKTNNPYRAGIPDCVYEGYLGYHWIEYKWLPKEPVRSFTPGVSSLQYDWLVRAYNKNRHPWVVVGHPGGCYILQRPESWKGSVQVFGLALYSTEELIDEINKQVS
jgi:hypothetical protein